MTLFLSYPIYKITIETTNNDNDDAQRYDVDYLTH